MARLIAQVEHLKEQQTLPEKKSEMKGLSESSFAIQNQYESVVAETSAATKLDSLLAKFTGALSQGVFLSKELRETVADIQQKAHEGNLITLERLGELELQISSAIEMGKSRKKQRSDMKNKDRPASSSQTTATVTPSSRQKATPSVIETPSTTPAMSSSHSSYNSTTQLLSRPAVTQPGTRELTSDSAPIRAESKEAKEIQPGQMPVPVSGNTSALTTSPNSVTTSQQSGNKIDLRGSEGRREADLPDSDDGDDASAVLRRGNKTWGDGSEDRDRAGVQNSTVRR